MSAGYSLPLSLIRGHLSFEGNSLSELFPPKNGVRGSNSDREFASNGLESSSNYAQDEMTTSH